MEMKNFGGAGRPLTAKRIMAVKVAIDRYNNANKMKKTPIVLAVLTASAILSGCKTCQEQHCASSPFAKYDGVATVQKTELKRTSESWDGAALPDYLKGKPELVVMRYVFPVGSRLPWHHHPVINYGILQQGELTIFGRDGQRKVFHAGEALVEMVGTVHYGMNTGDRPVVLDMFYLTQKGTPIAVQHPEIPHVPADSIRR